MRWLKRKIRNWLMSNDCEVSPVADKSDSRSLGSGEDSFHIVIHRATEGLVMEFRAPVSRNQYGDVQYKTTLVMVSPEKDIGDAFKECLVRAQFTK